MKNLIMEEKKNLGSVGSSCIASTPAAALAYLRIVVPNQSYRSVAVE